ncbi:hypothetical protein PENSPDRAFT_654513 [Peniophora sp. CONT]|nr:hypothetical protein PENSPDRAFT_654513 [Peniophora sp. CONT]
MPTALSRLSVDMSFSPLLSSATFTPLYEKHREDKPLPPKPTPLSLISSGSESGFADSESAGWSNTYTSSTSSSDTSIHAVPKIVVTSTTNGYEQRQPHPQLIRPKKKPTARSILAQLERMDQDFAEETARVRRCIDEARIWMEDWRAERQAWRREIIQASWDSPAELC